MSLCVFNDESFNSEVLVGQVTGSSNQVLMKQRHEQEFQKCPHGLNTEFVSLLKDGKTLPL